VITIVDYGVGNIGALLNMFDYLGLEAQVCADAAKIVTAQSLVLPGVGSFDKAMTTLRERQLILALNEAVLHRNIPVLGVCLGMQLFARSSEEGEQEGLGWIDADVKRISIPQGSCLKVPHIGWSEVSVIQENQLFRSMEGVVRYYFNHSYHMVCNNSNDVAAVFNYEQPLVCSIKHNNIYGVQFHPEKSHRFGMHLLKEFGRFTMEQA